MVDIRTGKPVPVKNGVGPRGEGLETDRSSGDALQLDREADPQTGEELPGCIGPQCESFQVPPPPRAPEASCAQRAWPKVERRQRRDSGVQLAGLHSRLGLRLWWFG